MGPKGTTRAVSSGRAKSRLPLGVQTTGSAAGHGLGGGIGPAGAPLGADEGVRPGEEPGHPVLGKVEVEFVREREVLIERPGVDPVLARPGCRRR